jgi:predicted permease
MSFIGEWLRRLWYLTRRNRMERELEREMESHRQMMGEPGRFGNSLRLREESRDVWGWNWFDDAWRDLKFACRTLMHSPGFTAGSTVVLALGIGFNLTLFQVYNLVALRPPSIRNPETVVELLRFSSRGPRGAALPYPAFKYVRDNNTVLSTLLVSVQQQYVLWEEEDARPPAHFVSANWFEEFGGRAAAGRLFNASIDGVPDAAPVVVLSHHFWMNRLDGDRDVIGSKVRINGRPATVIGVLEKDYHAISIEDSQMWVPVEQHNYFFPDASFTSSWENPFLVRQYARLKPDVSVIDVRESLRSVIDELALQQPERFGRGEWLEPHPVTRLGYETPNNRTERFLAVAGLGFLSLLVLTIACANLSNMVLARAFARLRELSIRMALGAGRWRVVRLLMAESALLAGMATLAALALSSIALDRIFASIEVTIDPSLDWRTMLAAMAVAAFAIFVVGFLPTWAVSRRSLVTAFKEGGYHASVGPGGIRLRFLLSAVQVTGSCLLLLLAAPMVRDFQRAVRPSYDIEKLAIFDVGRYAPNGMRVTDWKDATGPVRLRQALAALPETEEVAFMTGSSVNRSVITQLPESPGLVVRASRVEPEFFKIMRIPILVGRNFDSSDDPKNTVIVSRRLAMRIYGRLDVIGANFPRTPWKKNSLYDGTIIGVAEDAEPEVLNFLGSGGEYAELYKPLSLQDLQTADLLVRARTDARLLLGPIRETARAIDEKQIYAEIRLLSSDFAARVKQLAYLGGAALSLGGLSLILACIGIFGVISYTARLRSREISIRLALGAGRQSVVSLLMKQSMRPAAVGLFTGLAVGTATSRILESQRIYLGSIDAVVLTSVALVIAATCTLAALLPAWRALHADIAQRLREE